MPSNAYIASDGMNRMKVGKTNDPKRREKQIALPITVTIQCLDEAAALRVETQLREFVIQRGGIHYQKTIDWFVFDTQIYDMLCQFAAELDGQGVGLINIVESEEDIDLEIAALRKRYYELLLVEIERLRHERKDDQERYEAKIAELNRELGKWQAKYEILKEQMEEDE